MTKCRKKLRNPKKDGAIKLTVNTNDRLPGVPVSRILKTKNPRRARVCSHLRRGVYCVGANPQSDLRAHFLNNGKKLTARGLSGDG